MAFQADDGLDFTAYEAERVISSKGIDTGKVFDEQTSESVKEMRARLAKELSGYYKFGNKERGVTPDSYKAAQYKKIAHPYDKNPDLEIVVNEAALMQTANAYEALGWFTSLRLFGLRMHRIMKLGKISSAAFSLFTSYGGLSYIIELAVDCGVILKAVLTPSEGQKRENPSWRSRAWHTFRKGDRPARMANAAVWFGVNLACLFITGGTSALLNVVLFAFDVAVDFCKWARDHIKDRRLVKKLEHKAAKLDEEIQKYKNNLEYNKWLEQDETTWLQKLHEDMLHDKNEIKNLEIAVIEPNNEIKKAEIAQRIEALRKIVDGKQARLDTIKSKIKERNKYLCLKAQVAHQKKDTNKLRLYLLAITTIIFIGMALIFFPPAPAAIIAGSILAFSGSILAGLGRRLYRLYQSWRSKKSAKPAVDQKTEYVKLSESEPAPAHKLNAVSSTATVDLLCHANAIPVQVSPADAEIPSVVELTVSPLSVNSGNLISAEITPTGICRDPLSPMKPFSPTTPFSPATPFISSRPLSSAKLQVIVPEKQLHGTVSSASSAALSLLDGDSSASESPPQSSRTLPPNSSVESLADLPADAKLPRSPKDCTGGQVVAKLRRMSSPHSFANLSLLHSPTSKSRPKYEVKMVEPVLLTDNVRKSPAKPKQDLSTPRRLTVGAR